VSGVKFSPGSVVATPGVLEAFRASGDDPLAYLVQHIAGDWGNVDAYDRKRNELNLKHDWRLLPAYRLSTGVKFWIITEADRSATTLHHSGCGSPTRRSRSPNFWCAKK
jgi:hypothetical protein